MNYMDLDTPALLIDEEIMQSNLRRMQAYADRCGVALRPHTKTHKMSRLALMQAALGAKGIAVAKVGEAEVMAARGIKDIFIANEIVGEIKLARIRQLAREIEISFGLDSIAQADLIEKAFEGSHKPAVVLIEIEVGEDRSGIIEESDFAALLDHLKGCRNIRLKGIFSHDGHSYGAQNAQACKAIHLEAQERTLAFARLAGEMGFNKQADFPTL